MLDFHKSLGTDIAFAGHRSRRRKFSAKLVCISVAPIISLCTNPLQADEGSAENISIMMSSSLVHSPIGAKSERRVIAGAVIDYSIAVTGPSVGGSPTAFFSLNNPIPDEMALFVGDLDNAGTGPVSFVETDSGVSYRFEGLASGSDALEFSNDGGKSFDYVPVGDAEGYDPSIAHIRIAPSGALMPANGRHTRFSVRYRVRVK